jgi:putative endonuclease
MAEDAQKKNPLESQIERGRFRRPCDRKMESRATLGVRGESLAAHFLREKRGFALVARNWRNPDDKREEIDLVASDRGVTVFVEVKSRAANAAVPGYYAVDWRKRKALRRAANAYLRQHPAHTYRLDVVEIEFGPRDPIIRHFENIGLFG